MSSYSENKDETHVGQDIHRYKTFKKSISKIIKIFKINNIKNKNFFEDKIDNFTNIFW